MTPAQIAALVERLSYRAWPAQEEATFGGWILRSSPGLRTRRINSATSPIDGADALDAAEAHIREWFHARDSDPVVRILSVSDPGVDVHFATAGWEREAPTLVMTTRLAASANRDVAGITATIEPAWAAAKQRLTGMTDLVASTWLRRAAAIQAATGYASVQRNGQTVAIAQGVVDEDWLGLFDLNTAPPHRRRGLGDGLVADLETWSRSRGADHAYLQVEEENAPARRLYERRGYRVVYSYWYRRLTRTK